MKIWNMKFKNEDIIKYTFTHNTWTCSDFCHTAAEYFTRLLCASASSKLCVCVCVCACLQKLVLTVFCSLLCDGETGEIAPKRVNYYYISLKTKKAQLTHKRFCLVGTSQQTTGTSDYFFQTIPQCQANRWMGPTAWPASHWWQVGTPCGQIHAECVPSMPSWEFSPWGGWHSDGTACIQREHMTLRMCF